MSTVKITKTNTDQVIDYLLQHPDFFNQHQELISFLEIPHRTGPEVSSLIQYQVRKLQQENASIKESSRILKQKYNERKQLIQDIFELSLAIYKSEGLEKIYEILNSSLKKLYSADYIHILIFDKNRIPGMSGYIRYIDPDSRIRFMFTELFNRGKALCDSLSTEYLQTLFANEADLVKSTVIMPVIYNNWHGLVALGSRERDIYYYGLEIELLENISKLLARIINKNISRDQLND